MNKKICIIFLLFGYRFSGAQDVLPGRLLNYEQVFEHSKPEVFAPLPEIEGWLNDTTYLIWQQGENGGKQKLLSVHARSGESTPFVDFEMILRSYPKSPSRLPWTARTEDYKKFIIEKKNDLYYYLPAKDSIGRITDDSAEEKNPKFSPDGTKLAFTRANDLFFIDLKSGREHRLTSDGSELISNGRASWVYYEEVLGRSSRYCAFWWSPNSQMLAFLRFDDTHVPAYPILHYEALHGTLEMQRYPKAGDKNPNVKLGIYHLNENKLVWVKLESGNDNYLAWPLWAPDSKSLLFQRMNRGQDDLTIYRADATNGKYNKIYGEKQESWVEFFEDIYLYKKQPLMLLRSDKSGWRHLYLINLPDAAVQQLTDGDWNVEKVLSIDEDKEEIYVLCSRDRLTEKSIYRIQTDGPSLIKLSLVEGVHDAVVSPAHTYIIDRYSNCDLPQTIDLLSADGKRIRQLGTSVSSELKNYNLSRKELFTLPGTDGPDLPAFWLLPPDMDKSKKYPVIFKVYGGPGSASVWNSYPSLTDLFYAQQGIIILAVDNRGSSHFGKMGMSKMHRVLGKWETEDLINAVRWLRQLPFVDEKRIGITGASYGGYVTCMALTYGAGFFTHGIAKYSVTDWRFYDSIYTERYMDTPEENKEGYDFGSALTHAEKYNGKLLITHGMIDDNVHVQNTITFIEELQRLQKHFEFMIYPNQRHGVRGIWKKYADQLDIDFWFRNFFDHAYDFPE